MSIDERISHIYNQWFLSEPALHAILCTHDVGQNSTMACAIRSGRGLIEYNPTLLDEQPDNAIEELFRTEAIRLLLKHPYERQPANCPAHILTIASNITISNSYTLRNIKLDKASDNGLPPNEYFEYYAKQLLDKQNNNNSADDGNAANSNEQATAEQQQQQQAKAQQSQLWNEDEARAHDINQIIERTTSWGTLPGSLVDQIIASATAQLDYRRVLSGFRASVISSKRRLTRMRPNRRTGFQNMGSLYRYTTQLLVAVDVSGSVSNEAISNFLAVINRFFKYGIENIDVVQFDSCLGEVTTLRKAKQSMVVMGRGGTNFQILADYVALHPEYDGLVVFTDGYAPHPTLPPNCKTRILWVCDGTDSYNANHAWMEQIGRCCVIL